MRVTVNDIARRAGVSQSTVSRVLNNYPMVKSSTREKVLAAIEELGFTPDQIARSMVTGKTRTIGLIVGDLANPFFAETAKIIIGLARKKEYDVVVSDTDYDSDNLAKTVKMLLGKRVDGILIGSVSRTDTIASELYRSGFPVVLYNRRTDDDEMNYVVLDNGKGSRMAVRHLAELGHRRIAFISGSPEYSTFQQRYAGYAAALRELGLEFDERLVYREGLAGGKLSDFVRRALEGPDRATGFFVSTDQLALTVLDTAVRMGFEIPRDISVIGFDNIDISANPYINLTTVSQRKADMCELALNALFDLIDRPGEAARPVRIELEPELIVRKTTGICRFVSG